MVEWVYYKSTLQCKVTSFVAPFLVDAVVAAEEGEAVVVCVATPAATAVKAVEVVVVVVVAVLVVHAVVPESVEVVWAVVGPPVPATAVAGSVRSPSLPHRPWARAAAAAVIAAAAAAVVAVVPFSVVFSLVLVSSAQSGTRTVV